jgi:hypothetical protein
MVVKVCKQTSLTCHGQICGQEPQPSFSIIALQGCIDAYQRRRVRMTRHGIAWHGMGIGMGMGHGWLHSVKGR